VRGNLQFSGTTGLQHLVLQNLTTVTTSFTLHIGASSTLLNGKLRCSCSFAC
jgi:hypothetical protein